MAQAPRANWSPPLVAFVAWLLPGGGYLLLGQKTRGLTIGITIVILFVLGLLIGGVRALEVPGWDEHGYQIRFNDRGYKVYRGDAAYSRATWVLRNSPLSEVRAKPWSIAQALTGPVAMAGAWWSVWAATDPDGDEGDRDPPGALSHSRVNEIGVLYTAVAGMLNLLAIIDSSHRAALAAMDGGAQTEAK
jgi:hypothetical protein